MSSFVCVIAEPEWKLHVENKKEKVSSSTITTHNWLLRFVKKKPHKHHELQALVYGSNKQTMGKENYKCFAEIYLPCSVIKSQQVLLSSHSHSYCNRETRDVV